MSEEKKIKPLSAVALAYNAEIDVAPRIVALGKDNIALKIIAIAKEHNIDIYQNAALTEILSKLDVGSVIPIEAYVAVAEIISYLYQTNKINKDKA